MDASFAWYELLTTDIVAAQTFYGKVLDWKTRDAGTSRLSYRVFVVGRTPVCGLMDLPEVGQRTGGKHFNWSKSCCRILS